MASNETIYNYGNGFGMMSKMCMMDIQHQRRKVDIIIPTRNLNDGLSREDVYRWVEIGNQTIFPATIKETKFNTDKFSKLIANYKYSKYFGLKIKAKENCKYRQEDASEIKNGVLMTLTEDIDNLRVKIDVKSLFGQNHILWSGYAQDYQLIDTGECLLGYIKRTSDDSICNNKDKEKCFVITIDCEKALSDNHKLAILTFYRFLWSFYYDDIVLNTLKVIDAGVGPWEAIYYSLSTKNYDYYYGLLYHSGYKTMKRAIDLLSSGKSINYSFSSSNKALNTSMEVKDIRAAVSFFSRSACIKEEGKILIVCCISGKLKSLTLNGKYKVINSPYENKYYVLNANDYYKRLMLKSNFKEV